ncbi:MAG: DUF2617 family protein [Phycisphaerae bacterium]|jgi:hypothetical protein|nr:DUF2617 family protein [Phycisphaerae bacterium]
MNVGQQQSVSSLRFYLYDRPLHPELFDIYRDYQLIKNGYEAQLWITGCTHVIGFYRGRQAIVEATADAKSNLPQRGLLREMPFHGEQDHQCKQVGGINYMMNFQVEQMSPIVYHHTHHDLARMGAQRGLFVPFPMWMSKAPLTPFTFIDYEAKTNGLHVFAFHAFPEDLTIVKTQSIFELA